MRISDNYVLQRVENDYIAVPVGNAADKLCGVIKMNETGGFLWDLLSEKEQTTEELMDALIAEYGISKETARIDVEKVINRLREIGCIE